MKKLLGSALILAFLVSGCASVAVKDDDLQNNAAFALGVDSNKVKISNRQDSGIKTTFTATVGKKSYQCYVTGTVSVIGRTVSDAICSGGGKKTCDALSKRAGKC